MIKWERVRKKLQNYHQFPLPKSYLFLFLFLFVFSTFLFPLLAPIFHWLSNGWASHESFARDLHHQWWKLSFDYHRLAVTTDNQLRSFPATTSRPQRPRSNLSSGSNLNASIRLRHQLPAINCDSDNYSP